jgi:deazaflavin-dependent oxidoreductase (nitroreductase family)
MDSLDWVERNWPLLGRLIPGHTAVYRASRGLIGHRLPGAPPMLLLDHIGAKSATRRTSPIAYTRDGRNLVLVASKGGYPKNPGWLHNLVANPDTTVQVGAGHRTVHAHVADRGERARLWPMVLKTYKGYADYQKRTKREIPLVVLEPR